MCGGKGDSLRPALPGLAVLCIPEGRASVKYRVLVLGSSRRPPFHCLHKTFVSFTTLLCRSMSPAKVLIRSKAISMVPR